MQAVLILVREIRSMLERSARRNPAVQEVLNGLSAVDLTSEAVLPWQPDLPDHRETLDLAISAIPLSLRAIASAVSDANEQLQWRVDRGIYYAKDADVGAPYLNGNMHCELIGPGGSAFRTEDFTLGLFLLAPRVLYRDHIHIAPELYLTLTEPSGWRFGDSPWRDFPAGSIIWNQPNEPHATRVYSVPFLSVYSWTRDVHSKCKVVPMPDWRQVEQGLPAS